MCYEFAHNCDQYMIDEIDKLLTAEKYFMVSILQLNYLFIADTSAVEILKSFLRSKRIVLHTIRPLEMQHIISFKDTMQLQKKYGNLTLTGAFLELAQSCQQ